MTARTLGFALPQGSLLRMPTNLRLLRLFEGGYLKHIGAQYFEARIAFYKWNDGEVAVAGFVLRSSVAQAVLLAFIPCTLYLFQLTRNIEYL
jgi:hypothetical protein